MSTHNQQLSVTQGNKGTALRQQVNLGQVGIPIIVGQTPGPGTGCTAMLKCLGDAAYASAQVDFLVLIDGHLALFESLFIDPAALATGSDIELTAYGCAADSWQVQITLAATTPVQPLQSALMAFGVENNTAGSSSPAGFLSFSTIATAPASGDALFTIPTGTDTYLVTATAVVLVPGGGAEAAGDSYVVTVPSTWKNVAGVVSVVAPTLSAPDVSTDASMASMTFGPSTTSGTQADVPYALPVGLDAGTTVQVTINLLPLSIGE